MGTDNSTVGKTSETAAGFQNSGKPTGFETVKKNIADKIHNAAEALGEKAADRGRKSGIAYYAKHASEWLNYSAEYVRQFDHEQTDVKIREYVRQSPGRSLLIAGAVGMIIGVILRRR